MTECYVGEIALYPYQRIPNGWLPCDGRLLAVQQNAALFSLIGNIYGGDGRTNFRLPDLRGRLAIGQGTRSPYNYQPATYGGQESVVLTAANLPPHGHSLIADDTVSASPAPGNNYFGQLKTSATDMTTRELYAVPSGAATETYRSLNPASVSTTGGGAAHNNMQPFLALTYCIAIKGNFPPRP